jgi:DNA replicative helicase MCM subunit Mcm2 (Cdc46/Mcm family)
MRDLEPQDIDKMIAIRGMIIRASGIIPELDEGFSDAFLGC